MAHISSEVHLLPPGSNIPSEHIQSFWKNISDHSTQHKMAASTVLKVTTTITGLFVPEISHERIVWFDADNMEVEATVRWNLAHQETIKYYKWQKGSITRYKMKRTPDDKITEDISHYEFNTSGCSMVSDSAMLLYLISCNDFMQYGHADICLFGKKALHHVRLEKRNIHYSDNVTHYK
jgi:hypothetical protein